MESNYFSPASINDGEPLLSSMCIETEPNENFYSESTITQFSLILEPTETKFNAETHNWCKNKKKHALKNLSALNNDRVTENLSDLILPCKSKKLKIGHAHSHENADDKEIFQTKCKKLKIDSAGEPTEVKDTAIKYISNIMPPIKINPEDEPTEGKDTSIKYISDIMRPSESKKLKRTSAHPHEDSDSNIFQTNCKRLKIEPITEPVKNHENGKKKRRKKNISGSIEPCKNKKPKTTHAKSIPVLIRPRQPNKFKPSANNRNRTLIPLKQISYNTEAETDYEQHADEEVQPIIEENKNVEVITASDNEEDILEIPIIKEKKNIEVITVTDDEEDTKILPNPSSEVFQFADSSNKIIYDIKDSPEKSLVKTAYISPKILSALSYDTTGECLSVSTENKIPKRDLSEVNAAIFDNGSSKYAHEDKNRGNAVTVLPVLNDKTTKEIIGVKDENSSSEKHSTVSNPKTDKISSISTCFSSSTAEIKEEKIL